MTSPPGTPSVWDNLRQLLRIIRSNWKVAAAVIAVWGFARACTWYLEYHGIGFTALQELGMRLANITYLLALYLETSGGIGALIGGFFYYTIETETYETLSVILGFINVIVLAFVLALFWGIFRSPPSRILRHLAISLCVLIFLPFAHFLLGRISSVIFIALHQPFLAVRCVALVYCIFLVMQILFVQTGQSEQIPIAEKKIFESLRVNIYGEILVKIIMVLTIVGGGLAGWGLGFGILWSGFAPSALLIGLLYALVYISVVWWCFKYLTRRIRTLSPRSLFALIVLALIILTWGVREYMYQSEYNSMYSLGSLSLPSGVDIKIDMG